MRIKMWNDFLFEKKNNLNKIKKFANQPVIYDWANNTDEYLSIWLADIIVKELKILTNIADAEKLKSYLSGEVNKKYDRLVERLILSMSDEVSSILDYVNSPLHDNKPNIRNLSLKAAYKLSEEWHEEIKNNQSGIIEDESGDIIMTFPDGYYWINLLKKQCEDEADAMGHCGTTNNGTTLLSLRKNKEPHVTIAWNENDNIFTQIKGKGNTKPIDRYHPYIVDLIIKLDISGFKSEYDRSSDFDVEDLSSELTEKLEEENPTYVENSKPPTREELEEKYREYLEKEWEEEVFDNGMMNFWNYIDDYRFLKDLLEEEIENGESDFEDLFDKNQLFNYLQSNVDEDDLSDIKWKNKKNPKTELKYDSVYDFILVKYKVSDYKELFEELDILEDFLKEYYDVYNDAEDYFRNMGAAEYPVADWVRKAIVDYIDEDRMIDDLVDGEDDDYLMDRFG
jgi:hypothetical protein